MYDLPYHKAKDEQTIKEFMQRFPFALLTGVDALNCPSATQVPLFQEERSGKKILRGHLMRNTDHHKAFEQNQHVLAVFTGPNIYVSGTWYSNPHTPSTWNYMSVHIKGNIRFLDEAAVIDVLKVTSLHFENNNLLSPTIYDNLPAEYVKRLIKAVVAFEIEITDINSVFKLSQDRDLASYKNIIEKLRSKGESGQAIAEEMERRTGDVFPGEA